MSLQRQVILLIILGVVFTGLMAFRVAPELIGRQAEASESEPVAEETGPRLVITWTPPSSALDASFEARKARRPDPSQFEEVPDGMRDD